MYTSNNLQLQIFNILLCLILPASNIARCHEEGRSSYIVISFPPIYVPSFLPASTPMLTESRRRSMALIPTGSCRWVKSTVKKTKRTRKMMKCRMTASINPAMYNMMHVLLLLLFCGIIKCEVHTFFSSK